MIVFPVYKSATAFNNSNLFYDKGIVVEVCREKRLTKVPHTATVGVYVLDNGNRYFIPYPKYSKMWGGSERDFLKIIPKIPK